MRSAYLRDGIVHKYLRNRHFITAHLAKYEDSLQVAALTTASDPKKDAAFQKLIEDIRKDERSDNDYLYVLAALLSAPELHDRKHDFPPVFAYVEQFRSYRIDPQVLELLIPSRGEVSQHEVRREHVSEETILQLLNAALGSRESKQIFARVLAIN